MKLIVNADDFGYSTAINHGIIDCFNRGILTSTTMMVNMPGTAHAVQLAKENKNLAVGVHLVLTCKQPVRNDVFSLTDESGNFKSKEEVFLLKDIDSDEIEKEWCAQIEKFMSFGLVPSHFDSHHFVYSHPQISPVIFQLAQTYDVPIRNHFGTEMPTSIRTTDIFVDQFYDEGVCLQTFFELAKYINQTVEVMCHPGYYDEEVLSNSSYNIRRLKELEILTSMEVKNWVCENNIELINFNHLTKGQTNREYVVLGITHGKINIIQ